MFGKNAFGPSPQPQPSTSSSSSDVYIVNDLFKVAQDNPFSSDQYRINYRKKSSSDESWSWLTVVWTAAVFLLCPACAYFTLGALLLNIFAYVDHKNGDEESKQSKIRWAVGVSLASFIGGCIALLIVVIVLFAVLGAQNWIPQPPDYDYTS